MQRRADLPPDRGNVDTEQCHDSSAALDSAATTAFVDLMIADHRRVDDAVAAITDDLSALIEEVAGRMRRGGRLIYIGAGTSGRLGVLDASECPPTFQSSPDQVVGIIAGGDDALRKSSESMEDDPGGAAEEIDRLALGGDDTLLGIAAGGTTPYVRGSFRLAKKRGVSTVLLTCSETDPPEGCDRVIVLATGAELLTGSTRLKAGSGTKLFLNILSTGVFVRLGKVYGNLMVDLKATNDKLGDRAIRIIRAIEPSLDRPAAAALLAHAEGNVKAAIVMQHRGVDLDTAIDRLAMHEGNLRLALD